MKYLTKDNITFILAVIGSFSAMVGWIYAYITTRKNIQIQVIAYKEKDEKALFYLSFENRSRMTISITDLALKISGTVFSCRHIPQRVASTSHIVGGKVMDSIDYYNIQIPIELGSLGSTSGYVLFVLPKGVCIPDTKTLTLRVSSNRGKVIEMKLPLDQTLETL